jgi:hypothetical protein
MRAGLLAAAISIALVACTQAPPIPDDSGESEDNASTAKKKVPKKTGGDDSNLSDDPFGDDDSSDPPAQKGQQDCSKSNSQDACFACCRSNNPKAVKLLDDAFTSCACKTPGACASQCGTSLCAGKQPKSGDACDSCLADQQDACGNQAASACADDQSCNALFTCAGDAACFDKS